MNDQSKNSETTQNPAVALGTLLNQARLKKGMSLGEVAECLKLPARQIEAIEKGSYDGMPEAVFVRGFLTSYARLLDIDEGELKQYLSQIFPTKKNAFIDQSASIPAGDLNFQNKPQQRRFPRWIIGLIAIAVIAAGIYAWQSKSFSESAKQTANSSQDIASQAPMVSDVAASNIRIVPMNENDQGESTQQPQSDNQIAASDEASAINQVTTDSATSNHTLVIKLRHQSWLQVSDKNAKVLISDVVNAGTTHQFKGAAPYRVIIGYTPGAVIQLDGKDIPIPDNNKRTAALTVGNN